MILGRVMFAGLPAKSNEKADDNRIEKAELG